MGAKATSAAGGITMGGSLMHSDGGAEERQPDFSGWATKANLKCSDGRTILSGAFAHQDSEQVPLVWQHGHTDPANVLGHAILEDRGDEGTYCYGFFNETDPGQQAKALVEHGDIKSLSIFANQLVEKAQQVSHGIIREVSLVLARANPGSVIENVMLAHADGTEVVLEDEAVIHTGLALEHEDRGEGDGPSVQEVYDAMSEEEKLVVHHMVGAAVEAAKTDGGVEHSALPPKDKPKNTNQEGARRMTRNLFEQGSGGSGNPNTPEVDKHVLTHDAVREIVTNGEKAGSLKAAVEAYGLKHGIEDIDILFPDARTVTSTPEFDKRRTEWVSKVIGGTNHTPFARIKSIVADITEDEARAKGYIKGEMKKEEFFGLAKRTTLPTTVYKKQKLDRDDIIDITDFDVVAWVKAEMRLMFDEELARAVLIGDGREVDDPDKIKDPVGAQDGIGIRSILNDHDLYATTVNIGVSTGATAEERNADALAIADQLLMNMRFYKGSGSPTLFTSLPILTRILIARDGDGKRLWRTASDLAAELGVSEIVPVEVLESVPDLLGIIVNLKDYTIGADRGGQMAMFDDFDIDFNQYKYLLETRCSGALTKIRSALVVRLVDNATNTLVAPVEPAFDGTDVVVPNTVGVSYRRADTGGVVSGTTVTLAEGQTLKFFAVPTAGNYFATNAEDEWTYTNQV